MINYILVICGTFALLFSCEFFYESKGKDIRDLGYYTLALGIGCFIWNIGYALMGLTVYLYRAPYYRRFALFGVAIFISSEVLLTMYKAGAAKKAIIIQSVVLFVLGMGSIIIWGAEEVRIFYRVNGRTLYTAGYTNGYFYEPIYMVIITVILLVYWTKWVKTTQFERDKRFAKWLVGANLFIAVGSVLDMILPYTGRDSFPGSPLGCTLTFIALFMLMSRYGRYCISKVNLSEYIYDNENTGFLTFNNMGRLFAINDYAKTALEIDRADGQRISDIFELNGMLDGDLISKINEEDEKEWRLGSKKNDYVYSVIFSKVEDSFGEPKCIICAVYDRSHEEQILENIRKSGDAKSSFLASMTHEIRTPINAILGMCELILRECAEEDIVEYARSMDKAGEQLLAIVNDVLDLSKIQSNMMDIIPVEYNLGNMIHQIVLYYGQQAAHKGIDFVYDIDSNLSAYLYGDEVRILQIIKNLMDNAVKYTDKGQIVFRVYGEPISEDEINLCVSITDSGKGIREEDKPSLFDAFMRADYSKNQTISGTGIGLAIVYNLIKMMNGEMSFESTYQVGSSFNISVPQKVMSYHIIGDYEKAIEEYKAVHMSGWDGEYTAPAARVLVVDDNSVNLSVAKILLEKTQVKVDTALSGMEAIEMIRTKSYQAIFLDHIMPGMDGVETIQKIRERHLADEVPIIALTANDISGAKQMYLDYGFQDFLAKPISKGSLEKKVFDWIPKDYIHSQHNPDDDNNDINISVTNLHKGYSGNTKKYISLNNDNVNGLTHIFIINPVATSTDFINSIRSYLENRRDLRYFIFTTSEAGSETELTKRIQTYFEREHLRIYAIGGSGTMRNIINGIEDFERIEVAFCPMGLTNDFMKKFGKDQELFKNFVNLINGDVYKIDYIKTTNGVALNTFSLGLDANIVRMLEKTRILRIFGDLFPYIISFLYSLFISVPDDYEVYVDGEKVFEGISAQIMFGNGNVLGGTFIFAPEQSITDGVGCVTIFGNYQGLGSLPSVSAMVKGNMNKLSEIATSSVGSKFTIRRRDGGQLAMNFDGEMVYGVEKWEAEIVKQGLNFVVPKGVAIDD